MCFHLFLTEIFFITAMISSLIHYLSIAPTIDVLLQSSSKRLDMTPETVDAFVEHLSYLSRMMADMPALEREFNVVTRLYTIAKEFDVGVHPEDFALYQTLAPSFQHLKVWGTVGVAK